MIYIKKNLNQRFDGGHLGFQDGRHIYNVGNGLSQFVDMTKGGLNTKIINLSHLEAEISVNDDFMAPEL